MICRRILSIFSFSWYRYLGLVDLAILLIFIIVLLVYSRISIDFKKSSEWRELQLILIFLFVTLGVIYGSIEILIEFWF